MSNPWVGRALRGKSEPAPPEKSEPESSVSWGAKLDSFKPADNTPADAKAPAVVKAPAPKKAPVVAPATAAPAAVSSEPMTIQATLDSLMAIQGARCAALVDSGSGMILGQSGTGINMDIAAAGATEGVRAKLATMAALGLPDSIDDMIITLTSQHHVVRPLMRDPKVFLYVILDKAQSNLALARYKVTESDSRLVM